MAKTASQIKAENKERNQQIQQVIDSRNAIHQQQMAGVAEKATARTNAVLGKAMSGETDSGTKAQLKSAIQMVAEGLNKAKTPAKEVLPKTAQGMQKRKENQMEAKTPVDSLQIKKDRANKALSDFEEKADFDASSAHDRKRWETERKRLQQEADRANAEIAARENAKIQEQDNADISTMSEEDRQGLEQYAVNQVRDQNLPLEMQGMMPTAKQEAAGLIGKYGKQRADELAETFMRQENAELAQQADAAGRKFANERPVLASAATVPINLMAAITGTVGQLQGAARSTGRYSSLDANETGTALDKYSGAIREQVAQNIEGEDPNLLRKAGSVLYQGGMSFLDSTARMLATGGSAGISSAIAGMGAFSQGLQKYSAMGASPERAAMAATASAGLEYITEKLPTEQVLKIFHKGGSTSAVKEVLKQAFAVEPLGEEVNLFAGIAAEAMILGDKSSKSQRIGDLIAGGMTKAEAEKQFWKETFQEALNTYAVSAVAGGLGAGGAAYAGGQVQTAQDQLQENAVPALTEVEQVQKTLETVGSNLSEQAPAPVPETPMTETQKQMQEAMAALPGMEGRQELSQSETGRTEPRQEESAAASDYYDEFEGFGTGGANREEFLGRDWDAVGKRNVKAYMYENPEVKPYFQAEAQNMLMELADSTRAERYYNEDVHYESGGEKGWGGVKRDTSDDIAYLLDTAGFSYEEIQKGLEAIIQDNGAENNAASKRIEFILHNRLMNGHNDFYSNERVPASEDYVNLINEKQITAYDTEPVASESNVHASAIKNDATAESPHTADSETMPAEGGQIKGTGAAEANFTGKAAYANLLQEGNVQPDRPGDVRPMEVPKTDGNGKRVTEFAANAYGAGVTTDEMASVIESLIQDGDLGFDVRTNRESLNNAAAVINKKGAAEARNQITRNISKGKIRDGDIEQGILLYSRYAEKGDNDNASEMLVDLAQMANITGRNLQLFKLLRRMTVEGQVMTLEKEVRRTVESMVHSGQVKKGYEPSFDSQMMDGYRKALEELRNAKTPDAQEAAKQKAKKAQEAVYADAAAKMPATFKAKWDAWRYMAMLGNAKTQIRNIAGNAVFVPYKEVKDKMGALAEKLLVPKDQRTKSLTMDRGLIQWAREDRKTNESVQDALKYSAAIGDDVTSQKIRDDMKVFNTKALENLRGLVNNATQKGDIFYKNGYYERSLAGFLRGRGYNAADIRNGKVSETVLNEARSYAVQEAMKATFNDCNAFSDFLATELRYQGDNPVGKALNIAAEGVLPFRRTPANIAVRFTEYSPVGVAKGLWNAATKVRSGEMTAATAIDQLTAGLTGSAVMALGYALAGGLTGFKITGSGTDEDEKHQGHQDYALEFSVDGQEYSYKIDWAAPANLPLFVGANIYNALNGTGEAKDVSAFTSFLRGMGTMFEPLLALSCMSSLNDLVEGVRYADEGEALYSMAASMATSYFTQGIPALARQHYQSKQEYKQTTFVTSDDPTIQDLQKTAAGLGVSDAYKTDKVDAWGQKESQGTPLERGINAFLNPGTMKKIDNSAVEKEITRLNEAGYNVSPNTASRTVSYIDKDGYGHDDVRLTEEQFQKLAQTQGQTSRELLEDMFASKDYAAMTDAQKAEAIDTAYLYARKTGEIAAIANHTGYDQTWMMDVKKKGANEILRRVLNSELNGSMSDLDEAWDKGYHEENFDRALQTAYDSFSKATPAMKKQVYKEAEGTTKKYLEARSKGISHIDFVAVAENIAKAKGTGSINKDTGKATVRDIDRRKAIANTSGMTDREIDIVMKAYMADYDPKAESPETTEFKYQYAREKLGLTPKQYVSTYQAYLDGDKKKDKIAALRELGYDYSTANALYKLYYGRMKNELIDLYG